MSQEPEPLCPAHGFDANFQEVLVEKGAKCDTASDESLSIPVPLAGSGVPDCLACLVVEVWVELVHDLDLSLSRLLANADAICDAVVLVGLPGMCLTTPL